MPPASRLRLPAICSGVPRESDSEDVGIQSPTVWGLEKAEAPVRLVELNGQGQASVSLLTLHCRPQLFTQGDVENKAGGPQRGLLLARPTWSAALSPGVAEVPGEPSSDVHLACPKAEARRESSPLCWEASGDSKPIFPLRPALPAGFPQEEPGLSSVGSY